MEADDISAMVRALGIAELLEHIILKVQPDYIVVSKRVSKTWFNTIQQSSKIQALIRCLTPLHWTRATSPFQNFTPIYAESPKIAIHPALEESQSIGIGTAGHELVNIETRIYGPNTDRLQHLQQEFATRPFCTSLKIYHIEAFLFRKEQLCCDMHVPSGITIGHVLHACQDIVQQWIQLNMGNNKDVTDIEVEDMMNGDFWVEFQHVMTEQSSAYFDGETDMLLDSKKEEWLRS